MNDQYKSDIKKEINNQNFASLEFTLTIEDTEINTKSQESIETLKESIGFLEDIDKEYEKEIKELLVPDTKRKYIICLKDDCYTPIKNFTKKCPTCSISINKESFNL